MPQSFIAGHRFIPLAKYLVTSYYTYRHLLDNLSITRLIHVRNQIMHFYFSLPTHGGRVNSSNTYSTIVTSGCLAHKGICAKKKSMFYFSCNINTFSNRQVTRTKNTSIRRYFLDLLLDNALSLKYCFDTVR